MIPYDKDDKRFKVGQYIRMVIVKNTRNPMSHIEPIARIIEVTDTEIQIKDKLQNESLLLKSGGGFYFADEKGSII